MHLLSQQHRRLGVLRPTGNKDGFSGTASCCGTDAWRGASRAPGWPTARGASPSQAGRGMARLGPAWPGSARQGSAGRGTARHGSAGQGKGKTHHPAASMRPPANAKAELGDARRDLDRLVAARQDVTWIGTARQAVASLDNASFYHEKGNRIENSNRNTQKLRAVLAEQALPDREAPERAGARL